MNPTLKFGVFLPNGNTEEFPQIRIELKKLNITWREFQVESGDIIFYFTMSEAAKLPQDAHIPKRIKHFLPINGKPGYAVYQIEEQLEYFKKTFIGNDINGE